MNAQVEQQRLAKQLSQPPSTVIFLFAWRFYSVSAWIAVDFQLARELFFTDRSSTCLLQRDQVEGHHHCRVGANRGYLMHSMPQSRLDFKIFMMYWISNIYDVKWYKTIVFVCPLFNYIVWHNFQNEAEEVVSSTTASIDTSHSGLRPLAPRPSSSQTTRDLAKVVGQV